MDIHDYAYRNPEIMDESVSLTPKLEYFKGVLRTFRKYTDRLATVLTSKNIDYGNSIFKTGLNGVLVHIFNKQERIKNLLDNGFNAVEGESLWDTFEDLQGYATLGLIVLDKNKTFFDKNGNVKGDTSKWKQSVWFKELKELMDNAESN